MQNLSDPRTRLARFVRGARAHGGDRRARSAETQAALFRNLDTTFARARRRRAPVLQDSISGGPPALDAAIEDFPQQRPFLANSEAPLPRAAARASRALRDRGAGPRRRARRSARRRCSARSRSTTRLEPTFEALAALRRGPAGHARRQRPRRARRRSSTPTVAHLTPVQTVCNYVTLWFRNVVEPAQRGRRQRHRPALHHHRHAAGPEQRGRPVVGARPTAASGHAGQLPAHQPVPEHRLAGPAEGVRGRQRALRSSASRSSATCPGNQGTHAREDDASRASDARAPTTSDERSACRARTARGAQPVRGRRCSCSSSRVHRRLLRLHQAHPVHARLPRQRRLRVLELDPQELAGAHRRRQRRQGHEDRAASPARNAAVVTMEIDDKGLPIHKDATMKIRPRIFLEGNFFVDLPPGTPSAPTIDDGDTLPITQTATPGPARPGAHRAAERHARRTCRRRSRASAPALTYKPTRPQDVDADPSARGESAAESLNDAIRYGARRAEGHARSSTDAFLGTEDARPLAADRRPRAERHRGPRRATRSQLKDLVTNFNTTMAAFAVARRPTCAPTIRLLARRCRTPTARSTRSTPSFPNTRAFAREILPGVRETPATIDAALPVDRAGARAARPDRAAGPRRASCSPATSDLAKVVDATPAAAAAGRPASPSARRSVDPADRRRQDRGRRAHDRTRRTTRSSGTRWSASPARARTSTATACTSASSPAAATRRSPRAQSGGSAGDRLFANVVAQADRHAARLPGQAPAVQARRPLLHEPDPDLNGARRPAAPDGAAAPPRARRRPRARPAPAPAPRAPAVTPSAAERTR